MDGSTNSWLRSGGPGLNASRDIHKFYRATTLNVFKAARAALSVTKHSSRLEHNLSAMPKVATGYYAVCRGREIGVFTTWCVSHSHFAMFDL